MIGSYTIQIQFKNATMMAKQADKLKDFSALFEWMEKAWKEHNKDKFARSRGASDSGVSFADGVEWEPLDPDYADRKEAQGYADWLMVRTGELMDSLLGGPGFVSVIEPLYSFMGTEVPQASYNFLTRPTVWLDPVDRKNLSDLLLAWLDWKPPFRPTTADDILYGSQA